MHGKGAVKGARSCTFQVLNEWWQMMCCKWLRRTVMGELLTARERYDECSKEIEGRWMVGTRMDSSSTRLGVDEVVVVVVGVVDGDRLLS
jgi:hypothetical protein